MKKKRMTLRQKRAVTGLLFILPWMIGFVVYYVQGLILEGKFSLSSIKMAESGGYVAKYIGLANFHNALFENTRFNQLLVQNITDIIINVPFITFFSLFIAILLNSKFKGRGLVRAIFFIPIILGSGAVLETLNRATESIQQGAAASVKEAASSGGSINVDYYLSMLMNLGFPDKLIGTVQMLVSRIYEVVRASSVQIIIFLASLQSISPALYEVSKIEGATTYETFWKVTFPMVSPLILTNVVYTIVDSFVNSDIVNLAYQTAFQGSFNYGLSAAMSLISTAVICVILVVIIGVINKFTFYYN